MGAGAEELLEALSAWQGIVAFVGAGGKKSAIDRLVTGHPGRVGLTGTVRMPDFPPDWQAVRVLGEPTELLDRVLAQARDHRRVMAYAGPPYRRGRLTGVPPALIPQIHARMGLEATYVKADGARMRWIKAPRQDEPRLPAGVTTVVALVSARVLGRPFDQRVAHRLEELAEVTGLAPGERIRPEHLARLFTHPQGLGHGLGEAEMVPLINMVDDVELEARAREAAERALAEESAPFHRIVLAALGRERPLVARIGA